MLKIYSLLDIKSNSIKMVVLLFPPIYTIWLYAIGKRLLMKQQKKDILFSIFGIATILFFTYAWLITPILQFFNYKINTTGDSALPVIFATFFFWFGTIGRVTFLSIKYDRSATPDYFYSIVNYIDYIWKFFIFIYWPLSIWSFQKKVNHYNNILI